MNLNDFAKNARQLSEELPRELAQEQADRLQSVYDRVLRLGQGKSLIEVKDLLAREWRSTFGTNITDPELSERAAKLAEGQQIKVVLRMKS